MERAFLESLLHAEHRVLGFRLRPFCAWHLIALDACGSPFAGAGEFGETVEDQFAALLLAARVCSAGYDPELRCLDVPVAAGPTDPDDDRFARYVPVIGEQVSAFIDYLDDYAHKASPEFYQAEPAAGAGAKRAASGFDDLQIMLGFLAQAGIYGRAAYEMPLGEARWLAAVIRATTPGWGALELIPDKHREAQARIDAALARQQEGGG